MLKAHFFVALFAGMLNPLVWYWIKPAAFHLIYGNFSVALTTAAGNIVGAVLALHFMRKISAGTSGILRKAMVIYVGAIVAGIFPAAGLYLLLAWQIWFVPSFDLTWWISMSIPGFLATYIAYILVNLFVTPL